MAQKREMEFDSIYGGMGSVDEDEMLEGNKDLPTKKDGNNEQAKLKEDKQIKAETDLEINGKGYHISF